MFNVLVFVVGALVWEHLAKMRVCLLVNDSNVLFSDICFGFLSETLRAEDKS